MNIICLNIWGGRAGSENLLAFFKKYRDTTDVFCLQEVWSDRYEFLEGALAGGAPISHENIMTYAFQEISAVLPDHIPYFKPSFLHSYGLCMFVHKDLIVINEGDVFVHLERGYIPEGADVGNHARNMQFVTIETETGSKTILNIHGLWNGRGESDSDHRLIQSERILEYISSLTNPFVLCGDFNLTPDTESLKKIERAGHRNLISEYDITSTRTSLYTKSERFADYAFASEGIEVLNFEILSDEVSDHAPLRISIK